MVSKTDYYTTEQLRVISEVFSLLEEVDVFDIDDYIKLAHVVGNGMLTRLRLTPDKNLGSRLAHLYALVCCALKYEPFSDDQILVSFEGLNPAFHFDCDLILEIDNTILLIDFTADDSYDNIRKKTITLQQKATDPSLQHYKVDTIVHVFKPANFPIAFSYLCSEPKNSEPESYSFRLLENLASKSVDYNSRFIKNCTKVYDYAIKSISDHPISNKNYNTTHLSEQKVDLAVKAVSSNNLSDIIPLFASTNKKAYEPYIDVLKEITAQAHSIKESFAHVEAQISASKITLSETLYKLTDDPLAKLLYHAQLFTNNIYGITELNAIHHLDHFPLASGNKRILNHESEYTIAAKHIGGHFFIIKFNYNNLDKQLRRIILHDNEPSQTTPKGTKSSLEKCISTIKEQENALNNISKILNKRVIDKSNSTIWDKIISLSQLVREDIGNLGKISTNLLNSTCFTLSHITGGSLVSHYYEIVKTFAASIKNSHKDETYYVGVNGPYISVTITKMCATQDSFKRSHYCVISKNPKDVSSRDIVWKKQHFTGSVTRSDFRSLDHNQVAYYLRLPYYILSLLTWDIESNLTKGKIITSDLPEKITNTILHCLVNRDVFSQAAQQVRYLYISSIGFGSNPVSIADKIRFITPVYTWEYIYLVRMLKLGLSLSIVRDADVLHKVSVDGELSVVFPHTSRPSRSFNHTVSSMYYCNIFNKFRAYHEVSEAFCYNELDEEFSIYESCKNSNPDFLAALSFNTINNINDYSYLVSTEFVRNECNFIDKLLKNGVGRFRASAAFIIAASNKYLKCPDETIRTVYHNLGKSPIEACTMRGSMSSGPATDRNQGCRAATAILEELYKKYDTKPEELNNNSWLHTVFMDNIEKTGGDASIFSFVIDQLADSSVTYIYRIVQKDQIGNREISVLNAVFRLGALFTETVSRSIYDIIKDVDLLENKDKDYEFETAVQRAKLDTKDHALCFDNTDQKRWGPNHMLNFFSFMFYGSLHSERGLLRILYFIANKTLHKEAKFPESLINLFKKYVNNNNSTVAITREGLDKDHGSDTLKTFFEHNASNLFNNKFSKKLPYGMCQGIFHSTSSIYHAIMCKVIHEVIFLKFGKLVNIKSYCTSDDSSRIIKIHNSLHRLDTIKYIHTVISNCGILMNIIRNESKSAFNFHIAEFNSIFFKKGIMATPSLKQRISKIDVGDGSNHVEDYLAAISSASNYFSVGGSYAGTVILSILNISLHTEQWSRWNKVLDRSYFYPVELGGFPVIEPFSTCISGAASNLYLRSAAHLKPREYAELFSTIITETPEEFTLLDYFRVPKSISEDATKIKIFKSTGALGLHTLVRTDKKLSQFEQRHGISKWTFPSHFLSLKHNSSDSRFFLYNIYKNGCMSLFSESLGVNSFYKRFTDPWLSKDRRCVKISKNSVLKVLGFDENSRYTYDAINNELNKIKDHDVTKLLAKIKENNNVTEFTQNLIDQLTPRFEDAKEITNFICSQECSDYIEAAYLPATSRITLRGHQALDQEKYTADLIKVLAGEKARLLITEFYNDHRKFDSLPTAVNCPNLELKDAILVSQNSIFAFNKYIKRNTKMITSGKPDNLSALVTMTLKSRYFEGIGVRLVGSLKLIGDRSHAFSYTNWYKRLNEKSAEYVTNVANNSTRQLYSDVVKYGIISDHTTLTQKDNFEILDIPSDSKHLKVNALSRAPLISFCKSWVSTCATYSFTYETIQALFRGKLLSRNEFRTDDNTFVRCSTGLYFDISVNNLGVSHLIETNVGDRGESFTHIFLIESSSQEIEVDIGLTTLGKTRDWAKLICEYFSIRKRVFTDRFYRIGKKSDRVVFKSVNTSTTFDLDVLPYTITIGFKTKDYVLPITHSNPKNIKDLKLGYQLDQFDIIKAVRIYTKILDETEELTKIPADVLKTINFLIYNTSVITKINKINSIINQSFYGLVFDNTSQVDIFKALILDDKFATKTVNTSKLYQYVNNLFKAPTLKENYLTALSLEDRLSLSLDNIVDTSDTILEDDVTEDINYEFEEDDDQSVEEEKETDSIIDLGELQALAPDIDDIDFDAFDDDDLLEDGEDTFQAFKISLTTTDDDQVSIKSSRTGLTVNPNNEFPYSILNFIRNWSYNNQLKPRIGIPREYKTIADIPKAFLSTLRFADTVRSDLFESLTGVSSVSLPCPLSDLIVIRAVLA